MKNNENIVVVGIDIKDDVIVKYHYAEVVIDNDGSAKLVKLED